VAGKPVQFLDRAPLDASFGEGDEQIRYVLDDWQVPLSYLAQRDWVADPTVAKPQTADSSNLRDHRWHRASTEMIRLNGGRPIIFSYGPDGKEQLSKTWMMPTGGKASLVADWTSKDNPGKIDDPLNADNVYADPALAEKLAKGSP